MRLDKYISQSTDLSRKEVKQLLKMGVIAVDGIPVKSSSMHILEAQIVSIEGEEIQRPRARYFMLYKPEGYVSVTKDSLHPSALELLDEPNKEKLQIAGRLDIDTTGLLLITDDGKWNHAVTSPKKRCDKVYYATLTYDISPETKDNFLQGVMLDGETKATLPAILEEVYSNEARLTIQEGKYHQVKRMFAAVGNKVTELHRERIGSICLDKELAPGEYRALTEEEITSITHSMSE